MGCCRLDCFGLERPATVNLAIKRRSLQKAEQFLASREIGSSRRTPLFKGINVTWQTIPIYKYMTYAHEDFVPGCRYISRSSINRLRRLSESVYGIWSATLTPEMTCDPFNIARNVAKMFLDMIVACDVRRRDWSIGSLGTACVCSFSRPLRDIYSRCHHSPQRRTEPALRRMRRVFRGTASKCYCAPCPVDMSKWNTCRLYERSRCIEVTSWALRSSDPTTVRCVSSPKCADRLWAPPSFLSTGCRGVKFTTHIYLLPKLRMSGAIPPLPLYACMACIAIILPAPLNMP